MRFNSIALAVWASGQAASSSAQPAIQAVPERPRIIVDGHGEVKTPPDLATIGYKLRGEGPKSDDAVRAMTAVGAGVEVALRGIDAAVEPRTSEVRVTPVKSAECKENDNDSPQLSVAACAVVGFIATQSVTVRSAKVKDAGTMVGIAGRGGAYDAHIESFDLRDPRSARHAATTAALADAGAEASAIASASRVLLGSILSVSTVDRESGEEIVVTGSIRPPTVAAMPPPVAVKLNPEPISTSANVTVTYAIGR